MCRKSTITAVRAGFCILLVTTGAVPARALIETYWQCDPATPGDWFESANWTNGVPGGSDEAYVNNGGEAQIDRRAGTARMLWLGQDHGDFGTLRLSGTGELSVENEVIGAYGTGTFAQAGGTSTVSVCLFLGFQPSGHGDYELGGGGLSAHDEAIGFVGAGSFTQTAGTNTASDLVIGFLTGSQGTYELSGAGHLSAAWEYVGISGTGRFTQTGGINAISRSLELGRRSGSEGTYDLSGTAQLSAQSEFLGFGGTGTFTQSAGTNTIRNNLYVGYESSGTGSYRLGGTGQLSSESAYIGYRGVGTFAQTGGSNITDYLWVNSASRYELSGGTLAVTHSAEVLGALDFADGNASATMCELVNMGNALLTGGGSTSFTLGPDSLLIVPPGFDPSREFGAFTNHGSIFHYFGSTLIIAPGKTVTGTGTIEDHVACEGTMKASSGKAIVLKSGLELSGIGEADLGSGTLTVNDTLSGISGTGQLSAEDEYIGDYDTGAFTQTCGTNTVRKSLYLGYHNAGDGTYALSGTGRLSAENEYISSSGTGTFIQTGGTNTVHEDLYVACTPAAYGTYELSGTGQLSAENEYIGSGGTGTFIQTGGANTVHEDLYVGRTPAAYGTYELSGTGQLSADTERIGYFGTGTFTQTGGTNTVGAYLYLGYQDSSAGTYALSGTGQLSADTEYIGFSGTGTFTQTGGSNTTGYLSINPASRYQLGDGALTVTDSAEVLGTLDFAGGTASVTMGGLVNLADAALTGGGSTTFTLNPDSLLIVPAGFDPATQFGTFTNRGSMIHEHGSTLLVPASQGFTGTGMIADHVVCEGTITATSGKGIDLRGGLNVSGAGDVDLGSGALTVDDDLSGLSGMGQLSAEAEHIGSSGSGTFAQHGGTNTISEVLSVGSASEAKGTYTISAGRLATGSLLVGYPGDGTLRITGAEAEIAVCQRLLFGPRGSFTATPGSTIHMTGASLDNTSIDPDSLSGLANLTLIFEGGSEETASFEVAGKDLGSVMVGFEGNFALGTLEVGGEDPGNVRLLDRSDNQSSPWRNEALYVWNLDVGPGSQLDLNGLNLYYLQGTIDPTATVVTDGGSLVLVPEPSTTALLVLGMAALMLGIRRARRAGKRCLFSAGSGCP